MTRASEISEYWLEKLEKEYSATTGQLSGAATIRILLAEVRSLRTDNEELRELVYQAIPGQFDACGNSYVNAWLEKWLTRAKRLGIYKGALIGVCADVKADWFEKADI